MPTKEEIVAEYNSSEDVTHLDIATKYDLPARYVIDYLKEFDHRERDILEREERRWELVNIPKLFVSPNGELDRCEACDIILIESKYDVPDGWSWKINGRVGDLCASCVRESMKKEHQIRMRKLHDIGCIVCRLETGYWVEPEIHHLRDELGVGQRKNHDRTIPLCPMHHRIGGYKIARHDSLSAWEDAHGPESYLLEMTNGFVAESDGMR